MAQVATVKSMTLGEGGAVLGLSALAFVSLIVAAKAMALDLGRSGPFAFLWSLRSGQYEDLDGAALRVLVDDDVAPGTGAR